MDPLTARVALWRYLRDWICKDEAMILANFALGGWDFQLRRAVESDVEPIVSLMSGDRLRDEVDWADPLCRARHVAAFKAIDAQSSELLCVVTDSLSLVVATMQLTFLSGLARGAALRMQIEAVRVDEALGGQGLGSAMMEWAVAEARCRGVNLIQLTSDNARVDAHRFYKRLGFSPSHTGFKLQLP